MELLKIIVGLISYRIDDIKRRLEVESKMQEISSLQGELSGLKLYEKSMIEQLTLFDKWENIPKLLVDELKISALMLLSDQVNETKQDERWQSIENMVDTEIEKMKDFLLFDAKKPRDLFWTHGKKEGLYLARETKDSITRELERRIKEAKKRQEEEPLMEFMKDFEEPEKVSSFQKFKNMFMNNDEAV